MILDQFEEFYKALYHPNTHDSPFFEKGSHRKLNPLELKRSEEPLKKKGYLKALTEMERNKTPGSDGFTSRVSQSFLARHI